MSQRTLDALRNLAERPGTEAEGVLARELLERLRGKDADETVVYRRWLRKEISLDDLLRSMKPAPLTVEEQMAVDLENERKRELEIQTEIREKFKIGDQVFYNFRGYKTNHPCEVSGYSRGFLIALKCACSMWPRSLTAYSARGWHLSHDPVSNEEAERLRGV